MPKRSFLVALVVGTILNLINQGDALLGGGHIVLWKLALTYAVPYAVATYGAVSFRLRADGTRASIPGSKEMRR
ncbi:MAG TPA: nitrate/nitrite transporter NrtS [Stellaceae bacterium]|nr:nitrate/nitrite transporter NrtS [Stellaceae bacterium]